jgi:4-hydroxy-4-methyl-2-oxoglutarate aldolase
MNMTDESFSTEDVEFLRSVDSPTLANAIELLEVRDRTRGFVGGQARCFFPRLAPMVGRAVTVQMTNAPGPVASRRGYWEMWEHLRRQGSPSVIVVQDVSGEPHRVAYWGEVMTTIALRLGAVGLLTDGGVRDLDEVEDLGFQYFAPFPVVAHGNFEVVSVGEPVSIYGQRIQSGDVIHGDGNGVVLVPDQSFPVIRDKVEAVRSGEKSVMEYINSDDFSLEGLKERAGY